MSIMPQDESCFADGMIYRVRLTNGWDDFRLISAAFIRIFSYVRDCYRLKKFLACISGHNTRNITAVSGEPAPKIKYHLM